MWLLEEGACVLTRIDEFRGRDAFDAVAEALQVFAVEIV
jgi:hypothetical protein